MTGRWGWKASSSTFDDCSSPTYHVSDEQYLKTRRRLAIILSLSLFQERRNRNVVPPLAFSRLFSSDSEISGFDSRVTREIVDSIIFVPKMTRVRIIWFSQVWVANHAHVCCSKHEKLQPERNQPIDADHRYLFQLENRNVRTPRRGQSFQILIGETGTILDTYVHRGACDSTRTGRWTPTSSETWRDPSRSVCRDLFLGHLHPLDVYACFVLSSKNGSSRG